MTGKFNDGALVECVPNFSEGRSLESIFAILNALHVPGVLLLDYSADRDHNRMVATIAGPPEAVKEAVVRATGVAAERIDLTQQRGVHPRMGAADVVPFVPLKNISLEQTAELARLAGEEIWRRHGVPVFLYEAAAMVFERRLLENVRRGQFEGARQEARRPDIGGPELHGTAGASIVGARDFLVAFNLLLETDDVRTARAIAKEIRASAGGFPSVKALGVEVQGHAQVTMNITNYRVSPVEQVFQAVKQRSAALGIGILRGELIGLVPRAAFLAESEWHTTVPGFTQQERIVEERLQHPMAWPASMQDLEFQAAEGVK